jgi:iron-sulfur cluster assembly accessory protein
MEWFDLTESARKQISNLLVKNPSKYAVSLAVMGGGCAGFKYEWNLLDSAEEVNEKDILVEWEGGRFVVDAISMMYVAGTKIDWKEGVFGSQFEISNPNATGGCGCGESFSV